MKLGKNFSVLTLIALTLAGFIIGAQTWVSYKFAPGAAAFDSLAVSGNTGLVALMPILVALLAISATLMIANKIVRIVLGLLVVVLGGWLSFQAFNLVNANTKSLLSFGSQKLSEITGMVVTGTGDVVEYISESSWPLLAMILGVAIILIGIFIAVTGNKWAVSGRKYETKKVETKRQSGDRIDDWDALSEGQDPSES